MVIFDIMKLHVFVNSSPAAYLTFSEIGASHINVHDSRWHNLNQTLLLPPLKIFQEIPNHTILLIPPIQPISYSTSSHPFPTLYIRRVGHPTALTRQGCFVSYLASCLHLPTYTAWLAAVTKQNHGFFPTTPVPPIGLQHLAPHRLRVAWKNINVRQEPCLKQRRWASIFGF